MVALKKLGFSRSDVDWREAKEAKAHAALLSEKLFAGFVLFCNNKTFPALDRQQFGLPARPEESIKSIRKGMPLFLYNYSTRRLHGVFEAASDGGYNLDLYECKNTEALRNGRAPLSRYPAQVRVRVRDGPYFLEEEIFRPVLDYQEGHKFRLELTHHQVQQLLQLFGAYNSQEEWESINARRNEKSIYRAAIAQEPGSPNFACKSDSDSYSDSSSGGTPFSDEEWLDGAPFVDSGMPGQSVEACSPHGNMEGFLSQRTSRLTIAEMQSNVGTETDIDFPMQLGSRTYSAALMSGVPIGSRQHRPTLTEDNIQQVVLKGNLRKPVQRRRSETLRSSDENSILMRLHDVDVAVNSSSINCGQPGGHQSRSFKRQDTVARAPLVQSQVQPPITSGENIVFIPISTVHCQQGSISSFPSQSQRPKLTEGKFSRGWSSQNSRKQSFAQEKVNRQKEVRSNLRKQHTSEQQHIPSIPTPKFQLGQVIVPLCVQSQALLHEQGPVTALLPPVFISSHGQSLPLVQPQIGEGTEDAQELYETLVNSPLHRDGVQNLLQSRHWGVQVPLVVMPPILPRVPDGSAPIAKVNVETLHFEILQFAKIARPTHQTQLHAEAAIDCVRKGVKAVWPEADVEVFGSFATGLCLRHSDVDLAVVGAPLDPAMETSSLAQASVSLIRELASALGGYNWCESINVLDTASMPVLKCRCRPPVPLYESPSPSLSIAVDITIGGMRGNDFGGSQNHATDQSSKIGKTRNKHTGGVAREYVLQKILDLPSLAPLVLLLKSYLHHRGLSNVYSGGLGSFSLTLLLAFYLERIPIPREMYLDGAPGDSPVSPTSSSPLSCTSEFSEDSDTGSSTSSGFGIKSDCGADFVGWTRGEPLVRRAADVMDRVLTHWNICRSPCLGTLLLGFLQTFGFELDLSTVKIVLKGADGTPGGFFPRDNSTRHIALWIDDPLRPGVNIGAGSFGMFHVQVAFREMLQVLTNSDLFISSPDSQGKVYSDIAAMESFPHLGRLFVDGDDYESA